MIQNKSVLQNPLHMNFSTSPLGVVHTISDMNDWTLSIYLPPEGGKGEREGIMPLVITEFGDEKLKGGGYEEKLCFGLDV